MRREGLLAALAVWMVAAPAAPADAQALPSLAPAGWDTQLKLPTLEDVNPDPAHRRSDAHGTRREGEEQTSAIG